MAKDKKETSIVEDVFSIFDKSGTLGKQVLTDLLEGQATNLDDVGEIFRGERIITANDFKKTLEDKSGLDLTFGPDDPNEQNLTQKTANFVTDVTLDIFTSPDSLLSAPARLAKLGKVVTSPTALRAVQGATLGLLSRQSDDDLLEVAGKVATGAALGSAGLPAFKAVGNVAARKGIAALDAIKRSNNKEVFEAYESFVREGAKFSIPRRTKEIFEGIQSEARTTGQAFDETAAIQRATQEATEEALKRKPLTFSEADTLQSEAVRKNEGFARLYASEADNVLSKFEDGLKAAGKTEQEIADEVLGFRKTIASGFTSIIDVRKGIEKGIIDELESVGQFADKNKIAAYATSQANKSIVDEVLKKAEDNPLLDTAIRDWVGFNRQMGGLFNKEMHRRARLVNNKEAKQFLDKIFVPIDLHTVDLKAMEDGAEGASKFTRDFGPKKRISSIVEVDPSVSMREAVDVGATRYAGWFADQAENEAKSLLSSLFDSKDIRSPWRRITDASLSPDQKIEAYVDGFDKMTNYIKTKHLATGTSWSLTNYVDNVVKATIAAGPTTGLKVAAGVPTQALSNLGDFLTAGTLRGLKERNTFGKLLKAYDPTDTVTKIDFSDDFMEAGMQFGVLDSNKFVDIFQLAKTQGGLLEVKVPKSKAKAIRSVIDGTPFIEKKMDDMQSFFWNTAGSFGSAIEGTGRYITFKDLALIEAKKFPELNKAIKDGRLMELLKKRLVKGLDEPVVGVANRAERLIKQKELAQLDAAFSRASKITNDTFFDYRHVNSFERHVMKRIFPYWTFWTRNMGLWLDAGFDPAKVKRIAKTFKPFQNFGAPLSEEQRARTPDYLIDKGVRVVDDNGELNLAYTPSFSLIDALNTFQDPIADTVQKTSPLVKFPIEMAANQEAFGKDIQVYPTEEQPKKTIFEQASTLLPDNILNSLGIFRDNEGRLVTNNRATAIGLKAVRDITPLGPPTILDQTARAIRDVKFREKALDEAFVDNFLPFRKTTKVSRKRGLRERAKLRSNLKKFTGGQRELTKKRR